MDALVAAFRSELEAVGGTVDGEARAGLGTDLAAACARGRQAFLRVALADEAFVRHLARVLKRDPGTAGLLSGIPTEDLYLACACLEARAHAAAAFTARYDGTIRESVRRIVVGADAEDVREQLVQELLFGTVASPAKIATYSGKASLDRWVAVAARRAALMWLRKGQAEGRARRTVAAASRVAGERDAETAFMKERYRGEFEKALGEALGRLAERDRIVLRLYLVNGVTVDKIATMYKVGQATVSRWLAATRSALLDDIKETLGRRLGASSDELASLARMVASRLEVTLPSVLKGQ